MSDTSAPGHPPGMTVEAFLTWAETAGEEEVWELHDGVPVPMRALAGPPKAMAPAHPDHSAVANYLWWSLERSLAAPCRATRKIGLRLPAWERRYLVPDVMVTCEPRDPDNPYWQAPCLVAEILSRSTEALDRGYKLDQYRSVDSIEEILLVWRDQLRVQHWRRAGDAWSVADTIGRAAALPAGLRRHHAAAGRDLCRTPRPAGARRAGMVTDTAATEIPPGRITGDDGSARAETATQARIPEDCRTRPEAPLASSAAPR